MGAEPQTFYLGAQASEAKASTAARYSNLIVLY